VPACSASSRSSSVRTSNEEPASEQRNLDRIEKELTRQYDSIVAQRRALPWLKINSMRPVATAVKLAPDPALT
jgi:predicted dithiol-disulfide oxidoreductase (DUF899 family)